ncbi:MAG: NAD-binding protein [Prevotella sp.]|uniref:NAD(P)-dependent oxidoreductase n=1 Tax=Prevotella sp. TaxID=59823 RepID=UPI0025CDCBF3|nr:NAD(P)-dependent oxidoreductase [Prevotella sp.]MCI7183056.1 NAD-binding protein [Prevotella sp.]
MNLLLTGCFKYSEIQMESLRSLGYTVYFMQQEKDELPLEAAEVDATVCNGLFLSHDIDTFSRLKLIQLTSAGFDRVPVEKIKECGIELYNARGVYSTPMAEWAVFRVLEHYKQGWFFCKEQEAGRWTKHRGLREVAGIKVAVVGAGNVGMEVAKRFQAFGAETTGFDIHTNETIGFDHMALTETFGERVCEYDIVVITAPLLPSTRGLISREVLLAMKQDAILVNIARGGLIDEQALCEVLTERKDLFAALDVFETEPLVEKSPLWRMDNVAISPHNSFVSNGNNARMFKVMYENLKNFIEK